MKLILLATFIVGSALTQIAIPRKCPAHKSMSNFDANKYLGKWYYFAQFFSFLDIGKKCPAVTYSLGKNGTVTVAMQVLTLSGKKSTIEGYATPNTLEKAKWMLVYPNESMILFSVSQSNYWIVDTDYTSYAITFNCIELNSSVSLSLSYILTREQSPAVTVLEKAYQAVDKHNISQSLFIKNDQTNCSAGN